MWNLEYPLEHIRSVLPDVVRIKKGGDMLVSYRFPDDTDGEILPSFEILFLLAFDSERYHYRRSYARRRNLSRQGHRYDFESHSIRPLCRVCGRPVILDIQTILVFTSI